MYSFILQSDINLYFSRISTSFEMEQEVFCGPPNDNRCDTVYRNYFGELDCCMLELTPI